MKELRMENLENCFKGAKENDANFVGILVKMDGYETKELIINRSANFDKKLEYYKFAYNDNLTLKNAPDKIKITGFTYANDIVDIVNDLMV